MSTKTTNFGYTKPTKGETGWDVALNKNFDDIDKDMQQRVVDINNRYTKTESDTKYLKYGTIINEKLNSVPTVMYKKLVTLQYTSTHSSILNVHGILSGYTYLQGKAIIDMCISNRSNPIIQSKILGSIGNVDIVVYKEENKDLSIYATYHDWVGQNILTYDGNLFTIVNAPETADAPTGTLIYTLSEDADIIIGKDNVVSKNPVYVNNNKLIDTVDMDNLQVGGRNLIRNGNFSNGWSKWVTNNNSPTLEPDSIYGYHVKIVATSSFQGLFQGININEIGQYTVSAMVKADANTNIYIGLERYRRAVPVTTSWEKVSFVMDVTSTGMITSNIYSTTASTLYVTNYQIEKGNKATDWTPAPEDIQSQIADLQAQINALKSS